MKTEFKAYYQQLGANVAYYRRQRRVTQTRLALLLGIDRSHLCCIETGRVGASLDVIFKICEVLDLSPAQLFDIGGC